MSPDASRAIAAIGIEDHSDWQLHPKEHADRLPPEAGPLKRILRSSKLADIVNRHRMLDVDAIQRRNFFQRLTRIESGARILESGAKPIAIVVAAVFLLPVLTNLHLGDLLKLSESSTVSRVVFIIEMVVLLAIVGCRTLIAELRPDDRWLQSRASAERARYEVFETVMLTNEPPHADELPLLPLQLEYYLRYNFMVNLRYFAVRLTALAPRGRWSRAGQRLATMAVLTLAVIWAVLWCESFLNMLPIQTIWIERSFFLVAGTSAFFLGTRRSTGEIRFQSKDRLEKANALDNMRYIDEVHVPLARRAASEGDRDAVLQFIGLVQSQILSEFGSIVRLRDFDVAARGAVQDVPLA